MENKDFFNLSLNIMCIINENNQIEKANKSWEEILGYKQGEVEESKFTEYIHPEDMEKTLKYIDNIKKSKEIRIFVNRYLKKNGKYSYLEWRARYHNNKIYATAREITEKINIENKLKSSEENFKDFFEATDRMIFVANESGKIIHNNKSVKEKLGYDTKDIKGKNLLDIHPLNVRKEAERLLDKILIDRKGGCTLPLKKKNGDILSVDTRILFGEWDNKKCVYAVCTDITKEQENLERAEKIFQNNPAIMAINSFETNEFLEVNESFLKTLGYKYENVIGKTLLDLNIIPKNSEVEKILHSFRKNGKIKNIEVTYKIKSGKIRYGILSGELLENQGKKYYLSTMIDITNQKEISKSLEYKNKFLSILMNMSFKFINYPTGESQDFINESLKNIGKFVEADRVYTFDYDFENKLTSNTYEWCRQGVEPQIEYLQNIPIEIIDSWVKKHKEGKIVRIPEVFKYKSKDRVKEILEEQNIKSVLSVPMIDGGKCIGFVGFDSVLKYAKYKESEINLLKLFAQAIVDIRNKDKREQELIKSVEEKSTLMREIHHRVKNNLQLVSSLLYLQSSYIEDTKVKKALKDIENRVKSMALLHEKIYKTKDINKINFKEYIEDIIKELIKSYKIDKKIKFYADINNIDLNINKAINCGLIVNELITNSIQHAFKSRKKGEIRAHIYVKEEKIFIEISDDGDGFKGKYADLRNKSLGLQIVESLVSQLKGTIEKKDVKGTKFIIKFKK